MQTDPAEASYRNLINGLATGTLKLTPLQIAKVCMIAKRSHADLERDIAAKRSGRPIASRRPAPPAGYLTPRKAEQPAVAKLRFSFGSPPKSKTSWGPSEARLIKEQR